MSSPGTGASSPPAERASDAQRPPSIGSHLESLSKGLGASLAILYVFGFIVVMRYLSQYGVASFGVLHLQYLVAGFWLLGPTALFVLLLIGTNLTESSYGNMTRSWWARILLSNAVWVAVLWLWNAAAGVLASFGVGSSWRHSMDFLIIPGFGPALVSFVFAAVLAQLAWLLGSRHLGVKIGASILSVLLFLFYVSRFATTIYGRIPYSLGGGKPLRVVFLLRPDRQAPLIEDDSTGRSVPYDLLLATDRSFVVLPKDQSVKSIEFDRSSVMGLMILQEKD